MVSGESGLNGRFGNVIQQKGAWRKEDNHALEPSPALETNHNNLSVSLKILNRIEYKFWYIILDFEIVYLHELMQNMIWIACVADHYPDKLPKKCKEKFSCDKLANHKKCSMKYEDAMSKSCNDEIAKEVRSHVVEDYCKMSCGNCPGNFVILQFHYSSIN